MNLSEATQRCLCCPVCKSPLQTDAGALTCTRDDCKSSFPVVDGVPVLLNESASLFSIADFAQRKSTTFRRVAVSKVKLFITNHVPAISLNIKSKPNVQVFIRTLLETSAKPTVLIIGGGSYDKMLEKDIPIQSIEFIQTDVSYGSHISLICDAHDIPFQENFFDGVIIAAVLEHVLDPSRCVEEIHRVLKPDGLVYAETAFMQQVHGGRYDFMRFTHLGHRRLFRRFREVSSGAVVGPGTALAWSLQYFLFCFAKTQVQRTLAQLFARMTAFWLKYVDYYLIDKPAALDAASGFFFIGRKSDEVLADRDLVRLYRGAVGEFMAPEVRQ